MVRREFCRRVVVAGGATAAAAFAAACTGPAGDATPTRIAGASQSTLPAPALTAAPTLARVVSTPLAVAAAGVAAPTATVTYIAPAATATPTVQPIPTPAPTATSFPSATPVPSAAATANRSRVALVRTTDRAAGVARAIALLGPLSFRGQRLLLKPNFNSADPAPGSTHDAVLRALIAQLQEAGAGRITVADRSGMGDTRAVMQAKGIFALAKEMGFDAVVLDELDKGAWVAQSRGDTHWQRGFALPRSLLESDSVVQTANLKTHRFGGHFTLSLKNSVGLAAKAVPGEGYNYMTELHNSRFQRQMIAELNAAYRPALVVLDGVEAFTEGGPDQGKKVQAGIILAGSDRVAIDAVGVAMLRLLGTTPEVSRGRVYEQAQIARAVELGLGAKSPEAIELVTDDAGSRQLAEQLMAQLAA